MTEQIFNKEKTYKFEKKIKEVSYFYTGKVIAEDANLINIKTTRDEEIIINKSELAGSWVVE